MALRISDIIAQTSADFARPNLFRVEMEVPGYAGNPNLNLNCYNAQIPGLSTAGTDKDTGLRSIAYSKIYDDVILSFYCSEDLWELRVMQDWMNIINSPITNSLNYYTEYTTTIKIIHLSRTGTKLDDGTIGQNEKTMTTTLHEAYPKKIDPIQLDYGSSDIMRMTTSFTYRNFTQAWGDGENEQPDWDPKETRLPTEQTIAKNRFF